MCADVWAAKTAGKDEKMGQTMFRSSEDGADVDRLLSGPRTVHRLGVHGQSACASRVAPVGHGLGGGG